MAYAFAILAALVLAALFGVIYTRYQPDIRKARQRVAAGSRIARTRLGPIEYAMAGDGPPVLAVHGAGGGYDQGMDIAAPLVRAGFCVIAVSRFGYLRTPLPADASPAAQADAHAALLDELNIERVVVFGASAGGPSSMQFALRYPARTAALVLLVPAAYAPRPADRSSARITAGLGFLLDTVMRSDFLFWALPRLAPRAAVRTILGTAPALLEGASAEERAEVAKTIEHVLPVSSRRHGLRNDAAITTALPRYELERISAPTLIISVADDLYGTYDGSRYSAEHIPHARFVGYSSGGHLLVGHQKEITAEITAFLKSQEVDAERGNGEVILRRRQA